MVAVRVVQVAVYQVVHMVTVGHGLVAAAGAMYVAWLVPAATVGGGAGVGVGGSHCKAVLVHMVAMRMVQVAIVQIVHMPVMQDGCVPAAGAVLVLVVGMVWLVAGVGGVAHGVFPFRACKW